MPDTYFHDDECGALTPEQAAQPMTREQFGQLHELVDRLQDFAFSKAHPGTTRGQACEVIRELSAVVERLTGN